MRNATAVALKIRVAVVALFLFFLTEKLSSVQNERVAGIADTVQRDWGCFPNKQFAKIDPEGKSRK